MNFRDQASPFTMQGGWFEISEKPASVSLFQFSITNMTIEWLHSELAPT